MIDPKQLRKTMGEAVEREALAQLKVIRVLNRLDGDEMRRVLGALGHILAADALVPGILEALGSEGKKRVQGKATVGGLSLQVQRNKPTQPKKPKPKLRVKR